MRRIFAVSLISTALVLPAVPAFGQSAVERLRRAVQDAREKIEELKDERSEQRPDEQTATASRTNMPSDEPSPSGAAARGLRPQEETGPRVATPNTADPAALAAQCADLVRRQPDTPEGQRGRTCEATCRSVADQRSVLEKPAYDAMAGICVSVHRAAFAEPPSPASASSAGAVAAAPARSERTSTGIEITAGNLREDVAIHRSRFYRVYTGKDRWCGSEAVFDVVYVPGGVAMALWGGGEEGLYSDMTRVKRVLCPEATNVRLRAFAADRNGTPARQFEYEYRSSDYKDAAGAVYARREWLVGKTEAPRSEPLVSPIFRGYNLGGLWNRVYELRPGMISASDYRVSALFSLYVDAYSERCAAALPPDRKVYEHTTWVYQGTDYSFYLRTNYYKQMVSRRIYMRPELYDAYAASMGISAQRMMRVMGNNLVQSGGGAAGDIFLGAALEIQSFTEALQPDLDRLFSEHSCDAAVLRQFEANAMRAIDNPPPPAPNQLALFEDRLEYTVATDDFSPEIPELGEDGGWAVWLRKNSTGRSLRRVEASRLLGSYVEERRSRSTPTDESIVDEDISRIWAEGGALLRCIFENSARVYWFRQRVPSADPLRLRQRLENHPLASVEEPRDRCPAQEPE